MAAPDQKDPVVAREKRRWKIRLTRDAIIFYTGWLGILHQTLLEDNDRVSLLVLFGTMIGVPAALHVDEWLKKRGGSA